LHDRHRDHALAQFGAGDAELGDIEWINFAFIPIPGTGELFSREDETK
jgi:hypothetical protein